MTDRQLVNVVTLVDQRRARKAARARTFGPRALAAGVIALALVSLGLAILALVAVPFYTYVSYGLPSVDQLEILLNPQTGELLQATRIYDRSGQELLVALEPPNAPRAFIEATENPFLAAAFIASADPGFLDHGGFLWTNLNQRPTTLAERLAADLLLADEQDGWLKTLRARMLAGFATAQYGRQQILTWALNSATFGHWTFGVESAAQLYFDKPAAELSVAESALLAAVVQAPALNPIDVPELSIEYQRLVLVAMRDQGLITEEQFVLGLTEPLHFVPAPADNGLASDFTDLVVAQLQEELGQTRIQNGGLDVIATLDFALQQEIESQIFGQATEVVILNPSNGQILAFYGSTRQPHPAETMLDPFIFLAAFAQGQSPASLVWDIPESANLNAAFYYGPVSMRQALANNYQGAIELLREKIGAEQIQEIFEAFGLRAASQDETLTVMKVGEAYATFANGGIQSVQTAGALTRPSAVLFVHNGETLLLDWSMAQINSVTSPELAYLITDVLGDGSARETASLNIENFSRPAAIQIEESSHGSWFVGYSPQRLITIWASGQDQALDFWRAAFEAAHRDLPIQNWHVPSGLSSVIVCVPSGQLPDVDCPATRRELFVTGTEPIEPDRLYERVAVNSLTGKLATVFTAQEFVEERLFIQVPTEAESWARAEGIALIPSDYDTFPVLVMANAPVAIVDPEPFDIVRDLVNIIGRVGLDAVSYDVQVGQGLYPSEWVLIAEGDRIPLSGEMAEWDTTGLRGLYAIQLQVWDAEGNLFRSYSLVTLSN